MASNKVRIFGTPQGLGIINQTGKSKTVVCARFGLKESAKKKRFYVRRLTLLRRRKCYTPPIS